MVFDLKWLPMNTICQALRFSEKSPLFIFFQCLWHTWLCECSVFLGYTHMMWPSCNPLSWMYIFSLNFIYFFPAFSIFDTKHYLRIQTIFVFIYFLHFFLKYSIIFFVEKSESGGHSFFDLWITKKVSCSRCHFQVLWCRNHVGQDIRVMFFHDIFLTSYFPLRAPQTK